MHFYSLSQMRPTRGRRAADARPTRGRRAADTRPTLRPTMSRPLQLYVHVMWLAMYSYQSYVCIPRGQKSKSVNPFAVHSHQSVVYDCTRTFDFFCLGVIFFICIIGSRVSHKNKGEVSQMTRVPQVENHCTIPFNDIDNSL